MMLTTLINWRPIEETPESDAIITALLAYEDYGMAVLEPTIYDWRGGAWHDEIDDRINTTARWWVPESELTAPLTAALEYVRQRAEAGHVG